ncbi:MAG: hypothetical protein Q4C85_06170 [Actinomyces sp.]|uniref:hypothetical protein n=1 Tax=Actinomyces sp. TaxID=29317 RepID=UPI0026DB6E65|nr:hypothetical protein [Actinomyces sp.]MDO4243336.1 hypothetical protein [Actinomyces sp.]
MTRHVLRRRTALATALLLTACGVAACSPAGGSPGGRGTPSMAPSPVANPFDSLYAPDFALTALSADPVPDGLEPQRATGLDTAVLEPVYGTRLYGATSADEGQGGRMRHEYSRRQAFNADNTRYLAQDGTGAWHLYDAATFAHLGAVPELVGDCEPLWHAAQTQTLHYTSRNGGTTWWSIDLDTGESFELRPLYPADGEAYALHVSGQAFDRPGWATR